MIGSFRQTVVRWLAATLQSDVYVSPYSLVGNRPDAASTLPWSRGWRRFPGVARVSTNRTVRVESPSGPLSLVALDVDGRILRGFSFARGDPGSVAPAFDAGGVIVTEPLAYHRHLAVGGSLRVRTDRGSATFRSSASCATTGPPRARPC
jgi:putative ABC transport system permease protein